MSKEKDTSKIKRKRRRNPIKAANLLYGEMRQTALISDANKAGTSRSSRDIFFQIQQEWNKMSESEKEV